MVYVKPSARLGLLVTMQCGNYEGCCHGTEGKQGVWCVGDKEQSATWFSHPGEEDSLTRDAVKKSSAYFDAATPVVLNDRGQLSSVSISPLPKMMLIHTDMAY